VSVETHGDGTLAANGARLPDPEPLPAGTRIAIVVSRYHSNVTQHLLDGALEAARARGADPDIILSPGAFELGILSLAAARTGRYAGVAALGCVIRGETSHYDYVCGESARGIQDVALSTGVPCSFGVLTVDNLDQALARSGGDKRDSGRHAAEAVLALLRVKAQLADASVPTG
jgi:6,7-dimethyl-8-ribityllumazine synthase